jgi:hypothetical protein
MSAQVLNELLERTGALTPEEQLWFIAQLAEKIRAAYLGPGTRRKWRDLRGKASYPLLGEDAQAWITRTRQESDEHRESQWGHDR